MTSTRCLFCNRPVDPSEASCPALALAGVAAHAGCCGGCPTTRPAAGATPVPAELPGATA
jgi:hypothetical protein